MPLGFERVNERSQRPNTLINFIRTLPGSTSPVAEAILNRVAAICYPFMKSNMILVQALEEFPYNTEFVGRNFNGGEVIQLVLKDRNGRWLPQRMVEMVMVHELAHCKQMNHSAAFWKVRDQYAVDLRGLWVKGYTGEGLWGRGRNLENGQVLEGNVPVGDVPEHLCGGTYGSRRKRRHGKKAKETISYAEKKQRRILKKFGTGGQALGADDITKVKLEGGVTKKSKPRVAGSARGRDLRAAAALARFEPPKTRDDSVETEDNETESETEDECSNDGEEAAVDIDGKKLLDKKGHALVKICEDEDDKDGNAQREMDEINGVTLKSWPHKSASRESQRFDSSALAQSEKVRTKVSTSAPAEPARKLPFPTISETVSSAPDPARYPRSSPREANSSKNVVQIDETYNRRPDARSTAPKPQLTCNVCSLINEATSITCAACSNVLMPEPMSNYWKCTGSTCKDSQYINSGDAGLCGVCGSSKQAS
ncbi:WLM domain-containing protein [Massariosphaeria phaeospora]|uniref:WLM domain-containing protein n=1 Tax=Massariosphaeria phaeospora TaxID=100035 RepID=A0A7C8I2E7_9PLEO|nr:WLM domain-containing protein [Massariosphaeria phaeospora]